MARKRDARRALKATKVAAAAAALTGALPVAVGEAVTWQQDKLAGTCDQCESRVTELKEAVKKQRRSRFEPSHVTVPHEVSGPWETCGPSYYRIGADSAPIDMPIPLPRGCNTPRRRPEAWAVPSFEELYFELYNQTWDPISNIFTEFLEREGTAKLLGKSAPYPFSVLQREDGEHNFRELLDQLGEKKLPSFVVEVGTFHGGSSLYMAKVFDDLGGKAVPILCVDPFTGDLNMWLNKNGWDFLHMHAGRPSIYEQFMLNVVESQKLGLSPTHVLPFPVTSLVAARWLHLKGYSPDLVFLDSAHEVDETYMELVLFWRVLQPGGVLFGDDYRWPSVKVDLDRFAFNYDLRVVMLSEDVWYVVKPPLRSSLEGGRASDN